MDLENIKKMASLLVRSVADEKQNRLIDNLYPSALVIEVLGSKMERW